MLAIPRLWLYSMWPTADQQQHLNLLYLLYTLTILMARLPIPKNYHNLSCYSCWCSTLWLELDCYSHYHNFGCYTLTILVMARLALPTLKIVYILTKLEITRLDFPSVDHCMPRQHLLFLRAVKLACLVYLHIHPDNPPRIRLVNRAYICIVIHENVMLLTDQTAFYSLVTIFKYLYL